jgi:riboflavin kinase / FMN adenylyltransferase
MSMRYHGVVQKGTKRALALGFPTVNIPLEDTKVSGIYAARVAHRGWEYSAAVFADQKRRVLEAHLLDVTLELYGQEVTIDLCKKIRNNQQFKNDTTLRRAIARDVRNVRKYFELS